VDTNSGEILDEIITRSRGEILSQKSRNSTPTSCGDTIPAYANIS